MPNEIQGRRLSARAGRVESAAAEEQEGQYSRLPEFIMK